MSGSGRAKRPLYSDGSSRVSAYALRKLESAGVPGFAATKMTGHKTEAVYRRYAITDSAMLREAAAKLDAHHAAEAAVLEKRKSHAKVSPI